MEKMTYNQYTKKYIVDALCILLENEKFSDITVKEIVEKAGVGRATFYRNFKDKEDVLTYKFEEIAEQFSMSEEPKTKEHLYYSIAKILFILQNNKKLMKNIFRSNVEYLYFNFLNSGMKCLIQEKSNINNSYAHLGYSGALYNITKEWINGDCLGDMIEVIDALFMVFTGGEKLDNNAMKQAMINEALSETKK